MAPEEKMARRVLAIRELLPPFDLDALAAEYGDLDYLNLPYGVDGITIGIGGEQRPQILVNSTAAPTRRKFTLAHEIGHIVIPWHTGTIVSHLDPGHADTAYAQMEAEANRFAAELLMPSDWLALQFERAGSVEDYFRTVHATAGTSQEATFYKLFKSLPSPVICFQVDTSSRLLKAKRSPTAPYFQPEEGTLIDPAYFAANSRYEAFEIDGQCYVSWTFIGRDIAEIDSRPWREIYSTILDDTGMRANLQSINAVLAGAFNKSRALSEQDICGAIYRAFDNYRQYGQVVNHPLFEQYVIKRVKELKQRR